MKAAHPGAVLKEMYFNGEERSISDTAKELGVTRKALSELLNGHTGVTAEMALKLSRVFPTTAELWLCLQMNYELEFAREKLARKE